MDFLGWESSGNIKPPDLLHSCVGGQMWARGCHYSQWESNQWGLEVNIVDLNTDVQEWGRCPIKLFKEMHLIPLRSSSLHSTASPKTPESLIPYRNSILWSWVTYRVQNVLCVYILATKSNLFRLISWATLNTPVANKERWFSCSNEEDFI